MIPCRNLTYDVETDSCLLKNKSMHKIEFELREGEDFIPLIALLKATGLVDSGSMAQEVVTAGLVKRNGETELRKRAKIVSGDIVEFENYIVEIE